MAKRINVRLIMQLHESGMSQNDIATSRHMSKSSISKVLATAKEKNITYEDIRDRDDTEVYKLFFPDAQLTEDIYELPDYSSVDEELKRVGGKSTATDAANMARSLWAKQSSARITPDTARHMISPTIWIASPANAVRWTGAVRP